jgi:hypothetical protein
MSNNDKINLGLYPLSGSHNRIKRFGDAKMDKNRVIDYDDPNVIHYDDRPIEEVLGLHFSEIPLSDEECERIRKEVSEDMKEFDKEFFATR